MAELHPRVLAGLALQREHRQAALRGGATRVGWKMGRAIAELEAVMGTRPVVGYLTSATMVSTGATPRFDDAVALRAEVELALRIGRDVTADDDLARAREAIDAIAVALELVDVGPPRGEIEPILEANVFHRAFALGRPRAVDPAQRRHARLAVNGDVRGTSPVPEDHGATVRAAASVLDAMGEALAPGDFLMAGGLVHVPVGPGDRVSVEIDGLGRVEVTLGQPRTAAAGCVHDPPTG